MDPVSLIVMALVQGALNAVTKITEDGLTSAYSNLKRQIIAKTPAPAPAAAASPAGSDPLAPPIEVVPTSPSIEAAIRELEQDPRSLERQDNVARLLRQAGLGKDQEIVALSGELFQLLEDPMSIVGRSIDPVEAAQRRAGVNAVERVLERHVGTVMSARATHVVEDTGLLTSDVEASSALPEAVRGELAMLHDRMGLVIHQISQRIEDSKFEAPIETIRKMPLAAAERQRAMSLVEADKRIHVSYKNLQNTVEFFSHLNEVVLRRVEHERNADNETNMMLGNAVLMYELTDYVINYIDAFVAVGGDDVNEMHDTMVQKIATLRAEQERLREQANGPGIDEVVRRHTLEDIEHREGAIATFEQEWERYLGELDEMHSRVGAVRAKLPTLELIRENSRLQIDVLQLVAMLRFLKQNTDAIRGTIDVLTGFKLAPLSADRVKRLLGVGEAA